MKKNKKILLFILAITLVVLGACGNSSETSPDHQSSNNSSSDGTGNETESTDSDNSDTEEDQEGPQDTPSEKSGASDDSDTTVSKKEEYLTLLNEIQKEVNEKPTDGTQREMEQREAEILARWDEALNEIYGVLKEQLSTSEFEDLREEQRKWIKHRDEVAKEESLEFEGGTMESLAYVAAQARLTKERCFELVENYMK